MTTPSASQAANSRGPIDVITAFVWDGARVLMALRSDKVSTYPRHWAGISGYLEGDDPLAWAYVEIAEETGIGREHLTLRRAGAPLDVVDNARGLSFRVHPFLFEVDDPALIRGDWEAKTLEWAPLDDLLQRKRQPVVPQLYEAFQRVWPPLAADRMSGQSPEKQHAS